MYEFLDLDLNNIVVEGEGITIPLKKKVLFGDSFSDELSIDRESNSLWISSRFSLETLDQDTEDFDEFLKDNFSNSFVAVRGLIRQLIKKHFSINF